MQITAKMVQDLREKTGAGMMDCKKALTAADGDMELAIENLRKSGAAKAEKKSGRSTNQGKVLTAIDGNKASIVEVLCETDFAAKTDKFIDMVNKFAADMLNMPGNGDISAAVQEAEKSALTDQIGVIGENMQIRRAVNEINPQNFPLHIDYQQYVVEKNRRAELERKRQRIDSMNQLAFSFLKERQEEKEGRCQWPRYQQKKKEPI